MEKNKIRTIYFFNLGLFFLLTIFTLISGISTCDTSWHIKTGEWIVTNHKIPTVDVFSWYAIENGKEWFAHEWLSDIIYYFIYNNWGSIGLVFFTILTFGSCHFLLMKFTEKSWEKSPIKALVWFLIEIITYLFVLSCRPFIFNVLFMIIELYILFDLYNNKDSKKFYLILPLSILWVNMHGGSSNLAYLLPIMFFICCIFPSGTFFKIENEKKDKAIVKKFLIAAGLGLIGLLFNPHTWEIILYPYSNMADSFMLNVIGEWSSPDFKTSMGLLLAFPFILATIIFIATSKKIKLLDLGLYAFFSFMFLRSLRFELLLFVALSYLIFNYDDVSIEDFVDIEVVNKILKYATVFLVIVGLVLGICVIPNKSDKNYFKEFVSDDMISALKENPCDRLFNAYNIGGDLILNDIEVFYDSRADIYTGGDFEDGYYFEIMQIDDEYDYSFDNYLAKYNFDGIVTTSSTALDIYLNDNPKWELVYRDNPDVEYPCVFYKFIDK